MNAVELINKTKEIACLHKLVNSFFNGDVYTNWNTTEIRYGSVNIGIESIWRNTNTILYDVVFYYADRLLQDNSNTNAIYSDGVNVLQSIINLLEEDLDISYPIQYTPFNLQFTDYLAGVYCRVSITSEFPLGNCAIDQL